MAMFGMEKDDPGAVADYQFDLEVDLKDGAKLREMKEHVEKQVNSLKGMLREGGDKKTFDQIQTLLHGYLAMQKVVTRVNRKMV